MERDLHSPDVYDYRQYDKIWQRVAPGLEPYPDLREVQVPAMASLSGQSAAAPATGTAAVTPGAEAAPSQASSAAEAAPSQAALVAESQLPGAEMDPCCMGSAAAEMLDVLKEFIEAELADRRYYLALSRRAPSWARQQLRDLAAGAMAQAKRLMAVHYLITGTCYRPAISCGRISIANWCSALRERYHMEACNGLNYARAADGTTDPCLEQLLNELSSDSYRHADQLMTMLERSL